MDNQKNYTVKRNYSAAAIIGAIIMFGAGIVMTIAASNLSVGFAVFAFIAFSFITLCTFLGNVNEEVSFNCPKCNEKVILNSNDLKVINTNELSGKCPKCNSELIFNKQKLSVKINDVVSKENTVNNNDDTKKISEKIQELYDLKNKGIITETEFENKKKELLSKM